MKRATREKESLVQSKRAVAMGILDFRLSWLS